ncbi:MAG: dicarboxylate/amino acid:cation symporter [Verrucomicrobiales bacterium]|nr:dicarboxylate/amino acid:cation symporter [Verrucomicrobiales bacterium]
MKKIALHWQILIALILAVICGTAFPDASIGGLAVTEVYDFLGQLFMNALKMLIVPLVMASIIVGVAGIGTTEGFGRLGVKTLGYYMLTSLLAIVLGLALVNVMQPGLVEGRPLHETVELAANTEEKLAEVSEHSTDSVMQVFLRMVPPNIIAAAAEGQMLGLITFALLFGFFAAQLTPQRREPVVRFWEGVNDIMLGITDLVMKFAPLGVFALVAKVFATTGLEAIVPVLWFALTVLLALNLHTFVVLPLLLIVLGRVNPVRHFKAMTPAMITAFSTDSSMATLPVSMDCVERRAGVSNRTTSFVLPLGATINMDGTALYECVAAMFIAQAYGVEMPFATQFTVVMLALLTSVGVAGVPSASLVAIVIILNATGLPVEGIGLILAVDRLLDMCRTTVNIFSDSCGAVIVARSEGETEILKA